ncbi:MAG: AAA family ATPase [Lewinellaceae bacterium]|nr:AAA family ATPase [Saprospiraceae bacterium]MCB9337558.1 AAA family ATPase [Lewinellaceae bacterium]
MIKTIRIQNFRSLQDVTLDLQDVNLLIGPNNSGKSNLLKAFVFLGKFFMGDIYPENELLKRYFYLNTFPEKSGNTLSFTFLNADEIYKFELQGITDNRNFAFRQINGFLRKEYVTEDIVNIDLDNVKYLTKVFSNFVIAINGGHAFKKFFKNPLISSIASEKEKAVTIWFDKNDGKLSSITTSIEPIDYSGSFGGFPTLSTVLDKAGIYSVNISNLKQPYPTLEEDYSVKSDASNLVAFLDNMRDNKPQIMSAINSHLKDCIKEFESISFEKVKLPKDHNLRKIHGDKTFKRLGVQDKFGQTYWADELSDGTLYFLALLAIIHQPDPPKLLMVEEPENGIHPRRIKEIIDYFFTIADEKGIQVILTTHSTMVIDQFKDLPESVFVFDKKDQSTQIRNLLTDIIAEDKQKSKELNLPELDLSGSLGDHWAAGLIGGVPR